MELVYVNFGNILLHFPSMHEASGWQKVEDRTDATLSVYTVLKLTEDIYAGCITF